MLVCQLREVNGLSEIRTLSAHTNFGFDYISLASFDFRNVPIHRLTSIFDQSNNLLLFVLKLRKLNVAGKKTLK